MPPLVPIARHPLHQRPSAGTVVTTPGGWLTHARHTRLEASTVRDGVRWSRPSARWLRELAVNGARCWSLSHDGVLSCHDAGTGDPLWTAEVPRFSGHLVARGGWLRVGGWRGYTAPMLLDAATGEILRPELAGRGSLRPVAAGPASVLLTDKDGRTVCARGVPSDDLLGEWSLPEALCRDEGRPAFVPHGPGRWLCRVGPDAVWEIRPEDGTAAEVLRHDVALTAGVWPAGDTIWVRQQRDRALVGHRSGGTVRVASGGHCADGVVLTAHGLVVARRRPGELLLISPDGEVRSRLRLDVQIDEVRPLPGTDGDDVLVLGKGALHVVASG
jgi:outer membrane protein assembly factor BamB